MKIFHWKHKGGEVPLRDRVGRFTSFKRNVFWFFKRVFWGMTIGLTAMTLYILGGMHNPIVKAELIKEGMAPVLERIAKCESQNQHYGKSGQVLMSANTNGTVDVGRYQINTVWFSKATEMGLDVTNEEDNAEMAEYIYKNKGTGPWSSSAKCWNK